MPSSQSWKNRSQNVSRGRPSGRPYDSAGVAFSGARIARFAAADEWCANRAPLILLLPTIQNVSRGRPSGRPYDSAGVAFSGARIARFAAADEWCANRAPLILLLPTI